jgi:hypothetical protein
MRLIWDVRASQLPMTALSIVGAKWRREVPPSRRLTAREQSLPWAILSFPAHWCRVNRPDLAVGTPAATVVCSKVVKTGSCRAGPRLVIAARLVKKLREVGAAGTLVSASRLPTTARKSDEIKPDAIESVSGGDRLLPSRRRQAMTAS